MALESLFIFRNTKESSHILFYDQKGFEKKGVHRHYFFKKLQRWVFFFLKIHFKQNFNSHLYEAEDLWIIGLVAFVFCSIGMGRWYEEMWFFFFSCNRERTGEQPLQTGWRKLIKRKHFWKFPLTHFRCQVTLVGEPQLENSLLWYSRFYLPKI